MQLRLLGPLEVWAEESLGLNAARQREVLALLAVRAGSAVPIDSLIDQLWGDAPPKAARTTVQSCVYRLRRLLAPTSLEIRTRQEAYLLEVPDGASDLAEYERLVAAGRASLDEGRPAVAVSRLRAALALWRGDFVSDVDLPEVREHARQLAEARFEVLETCLECELELDRGGVVIPELLALTTGHPLRELPWQLLMTAQYGAGRRAEALETYQRLRAVLTEELGVEPSAEVRDLHERILGAQELPSRARKVTPRQLPASPPGFVEREAELARLDEFLSRFEGAGLCTIVGPAGVGKTSTAVHWSRRVAGRFPDGQLYADLRGFDPSGQARDAAATLGGFITALGVPPDRVPPDLDARAALFRSLVDDRRVLIVLDNARSAEQVRPLLAGGPACVTVVTSRDRLTGLVATERARPVALEPLDRDQARRLLATRIGADRAADQDAMDELVAGCAGLPLALTIVGAQAELHPDWPLAKLADGLRTAVLDALSADDPATDARAVFSWSYQSLSTPAARLFRLLGVHPGPGFGADAGGALAGLRPAEVQPLLQELCGSHQLVETSPGRYAMHDLLRSYAAELADAEEARDARARLLDLMVHTASAAALMLTPSLDPIELDPCDPLVVLDPPTTAAAAREWLLTEQDSLVGLTRVDGADLAVWRLSWALSGFLDRQGAWREWESLARRGLAAAERAGTVTDRALAHRWLARALFRLGRFDETLAEELHGLQLCSAAGDLPNQAHGHLSLAMVQSRLGQLEAAIGSATQARDRFAELGHRSGHANALNNLGWYHSLIGEHEETVRCCRQALAELREIGEVAGESDTLHSLGVAYGRLGRDDEALRCFQRAIVLQERLGRKYKLAVALDSAGDVHRTRGDHTAAVASWRRALDLFEDLDDPRATSVAAKLT